MCHLILFLPVIALPMLWLLPLSIGVPLYGLVLIIAVGAYVMVLRAMRRPVTAGPEALMHAIGEVLLVDRDQAYIGAQSKQWAATCSEGVLVVGDMVKVIRRDGLTLQSDIPPNGQSGALLTCVKENSLYRSRFAIVDTDTFGASSKEI